MKGDELHAANANKYPWGKVLTWTGAAFLLGLVLGDTPPHVGGAANVLAYKVMAGIAAVVVVAPIAAIVVYVNHRSRKGGTS